MNRRLLMVVVAIVVAAIAVYIRRTRARPTSGPVTVDGVTYRTSSDASWHVGDDPEFRAKMAAQDAADGVKNRPCLADG